MQKSLGTPGGFLFLKEQPLQIAHSYILFYKPYNVLSQFTSEDGHQSLADFGPFPKNVYAAGRLDADSEGLLLLTDDNELKHKLMEPKFEHRRTYLVQVEGTVDDRSINPLKKGVLIQGKKTKPADVEIILEEPHLPARPVPIRYRKNIPTSWLRITLREGRNRQVRKMTAAIGHPTLRLIRVAIEFLELGNLQPGEFRHVTPTEFSRLSLLLQVHA